jgi:Asp-tRNA(Asn)/Glu-tRNA(Gln) amidotransferase A subunit family amidase
LDLVGLACRLNKIYSENGTCVKILENAGAIVIVRGNVPQLAMAYDSDNFIFG